MESLKIRIGERHQVIPPGIYRAKVLEIKKGTFAGKRETLEFIFIIADGEHEGKTLRGYVNAHYESYSEYTKLRQWVSIVTKVDSDPGTEVSLDVFYGKIFRVEVQNKVSRKTNNTFSNVTNILGVMCEL